MKTIQVNGVTLAYEEFGTGDQYLISTQNFFFSGCHMELLGKEPYHYHTFLIYMRGYNQSSHIFDTEPKDYATIWSEDVIAFAKAMGIPSFYYTGVSHGNIAGWYIAFHHPELLRGFVCVDGTAFYKPTPPVIPRQSNGIEKMAGNRELLKTIAWNEEWPTQNPQRLSRREFCRKQHLDILTARAPEEFTVRNISMNCSGARSMEEYLDAVSKIPVPVMLLGGALDPLATPEEMLTLARTIPGAQMKMYQHYGHGAADECPEIFARDCDRFFRDTTGRVL